MAFFHDVRFPTDISYGSSGGPEFSTEVVELGSGREQRNINWSYARERWNVAYGVKAQEQLDALIRFFYARRGRAYGFRFKNHNDCQVDDSEIGLGDGSTTEFQLVCSYTDAGGTFTRKISKPVSGNVHIFIDGQEVDPDDSVTPWSVDHATGLVTIGSIAPPSSGEVITATFDFDIPVRFDTDYLPVTLETYLAKSANVPIVEIML